LEGAVLDTSAAEPAAAADERRAVSGELEDFIAPLALSGKPLGGSPLTDTVMSERDAKHFGPPTIVVGGLRIWVHGRQYPDTEDYWDGNWLRVTVLCGASGAEVRVSGAIIHLGEVAEWLSGTESLHQKLTGSAALKCVEPELHVEMEMTKHGQLVMTVNITPDNLTQQHEFKFDLDQSYLPNVIRACREVLSKYPLKGTPDD